MPDARAGGAAKAAESVQRLANTPPGIHLRLGEIAGPLPPGNRISAMQRMTS